MAYRILEREFQQQKDLLKGKNSAREQREQLRMEMNECDLSYLQD